MISLDDISDLVNALMEADEKAKDAELKFKQAQERARFLREETIPSAMQEAGLKEVRLLTGEKVTIRQEVYAAIPAAKRKEAYGWLEDNGFGGLLKTALKVEYGRGEADEAAELMVELEQRGIKAQIKQDVHPQTLKAFLKEQIAKSFNVPLDLFGARPVWTTKID